MAAEERRLKVVPVRFGMQGPIVGEATVEQTPDGLVANMSITETASNKIFGDLNVGGFSVWKERD